MLRLFHKESGARIIVDGPQNSFGIVGRYPATIAIAPGMTYTVKVAASAAPITVSILDEGGLAIHGPVNLDVNSIEKMAVVSFPTLDLSSEWETFKLIVAITKMKRASVVRRARSVPSGPPSRQRYVSAPDFSEPLTSVSWTPSKEPQLVTVAFVKSLLDLEV